METISCTLIGTGLPLRNEHSSSSLTHNHAFLFKTTLEMDEITSDWECYSSSLWFHQTAMEIQLAALDISAYTAIRETAYDYFRLKEF